MLEPTPNSIKPSNNDNQTFKPFNVNGCVEQLRKPLVSLVVPAYNEAGIIEKNLVIICQYMESLENRFSWELIIVNDGSRDETGKLADDFARTRNNIQVLHHIVNFGLGQALKFGFNNCRGDYIVTLDLDLSYAPYHIEQLLSKMQETRARIVVASPYMKGGRISNVPWLRKTLSIWANRFLSATSHGDLNTLTGMVRAYDGRFLRSLSLKSTSMDINPEVIHKARMLRARIEEIPAHLNWRTEKAKKVKRTSSMRILQHTWLTILSGFLFRPVMFFIIPGMTLLLLSAYANTWVLIHIFANYHKLAQLTQFPDPTDAVREAFYQTPHTFIIGGMTMMVAIQLISLGILSMQSKSYFEEMFYLNTAIYKSLQKNKDNKS